MINSQRSDEIIRVFNSVFSVMEGTVLSGGAAEPFYEPGHPATIFFREDFERSALHEVAHWCIAGRYRRQLPDYGYWYRAEGRDCSRQAAFYEVETRPQAIEQLFCEALDLPFKVSLDNLSVVLDDPSVTRFAEAVSAQASAFRLTGLPQRAAVFRDALRQRREHAQGNHAP
ncbi:MAG: elongation factor P hydroxylase [Luminiphilus sp.]|nr:elongation factor P hydroxylase [Luminiphilus sp.]